MTPIKDKTRFFIIVGLAVAIVATTYFMRQFITLSVSIPKIRINIQADVTNSPDVQPTFSITAPTAVPTSIPAASRIKSTPVPVATTVATSMPSAPRMEPTFTLVNQGPVDDIILAEGLVAYYPFNGNANDASGNGNHGVIYGALLTSDRFDNPDSAYYFDGLNDYIDVTGLRLKQVDFAVSGWFKTTYTNDDPNGSCIVDKYPQKGQPWTIRLHVDGTLRFLCDTSIFSSAPVNDGLWRHFVALRSGSTIKLFLDGELQGSAVSMSSTANSRPLCLGCVHGLAGGQARFFQGVIDDVRIYERALTETEIQTLYHEGGWGQ